MKIELKRSTPVEFSYERDGQMITFTAPCCTVGGYREALRLEVEAGEDRLLLQAVALCGESCRVHLEAMDVEMLQEVVQSQVALYSGLNPEAAVELLRVVKKKALAALLGSSFSAATS